MAVIVFRSIHYVFVFRSILYRIVVQVAAVFAFGREDIIPDMFRELLPRPGDPCSVEVTEVEKKISVFRYYLERHIELDGKDHGPLAIRLVEQLNGQVSL